MTALIADVVELARGDGPSRRRWKTCGSICSSADAVEPRPSQRAPTSTFDDATRGDVVHGAPPTIERAVCEPARQRGQVEPGGERVEISVADGEVVVRDHGPGIDEEDLPKVFDRFYRAPAARGRPGSGLGLAIVRQVAESHGGSVVAERAEGGGTLMRVSFAS